MRISIDGNVHIKGLTATMFFLGLGMATVVYLTFGMGTYWITDGSDLAWDKAWLWLCLTGWPAVVAFYVLKWALIALVAICAVFALIGAKLWLDDHIAWRRLKREHPGL